MERMHIFDKLNPLKCLQNSQGLWKPVLGMLFFGHLMRRADWLIEQVPKAGKDWGQEEKGMTEDEMVGWHNQLNGLEFEQTLGDNEGPMTPGVLQSMGSQRVGHDWRIEQQ